MTIPRLIVAMTAPGRDVEIRIRKKPRTRKQAHLQVFLCVRRWYFQMDLEGYGYLNYVPLTPKTEVSLDDFKPGGCNFASLTLPPSPWPDVSRWALRDVDFSPTIYCPPDKAWFFNSGHL